MLKMVVFLSLISVVALADSKITAYLNSPYTEVTAQICSEIKADVERDIARLKISGVSVQMDFRGCRTHDPLCSQNACVLRLVSVEDNLVEVKGDHFYGKDRNQNCEKQAVSMLGGDSIITAIKYDQGWTFHAYCQAWSVKIKN
jgi:hypothetical protein